MVFDIFILYIGYALLFLAIIFGVLLILNPFKNWKKSKQIKTRIGYLFLLFFLILYFLMLHAINKFTIDMLFLELLFGLVIVGIFILWEFKELNGQGKKRRS